LYPIWLRWKSANKKLNERRYTRTDQLPTVSVLMSVYNEEAVIKAKMDSLLSLDYPEDGLHFYIGSDCSTDRTDAIVDFYHSQSSRLKFHPFIQRRGKPGVINELAEIALAEQGNRPDHIFLMTDASVMLRPDTLFELVKHFKNKEIVIVDSNMLHTDVQAKGVAKLENQYISSEVRIKQLESRAFGKMIGPFGGCYALRATHFSPVPDNFLVDDFYITMRAFEKGGLAINELNAICYEALPDSMAEEYRRKKRISAGNFQNLLTFSHLLWRGDALSFAFFSHKVLRWLGPFFLIFAGVFSLVLALGGNILYQILFLLMILALLLLPLLDYVFQQLGINIQALRALRYFVMMNVALLEGFIKFIKGIKTNVWQPPKRK
jgi:cellulose synthase/poly-beta-1,6-N-acetylglucosamine synthase-like glycosyltransferase